MLHISINEAKDVASSVHLACLVALGKFCAPAHLFAFRFFFFFFSFWTTSKLWMKFSHPCQAMVFEDSSPPAKCRKRDINIFLHAHLACSTEELTSLGMVPTFILTLKQIL